jgi:hypothetical protein
MKAVLERCGAAKQEAVLEIQGEPRDFAGKVVLPVKEAALAPHFFQCFQITNYQYNFVNMTNTCQYGSHPLKRDWPARKRQ